MKETFLSSTIRLIWYLTLGLQFINNNFVHATGKSCAPGWYYNTFIGDCIRCLGHECKKENVQDTKACKDACEKIPSTSIPSTSIPATSILATSIPSTSIPSTSITTVSRANAKSPSKPRTAARNTTVSSKYREKPTTNNKTVIPTVESGASGLSDSNRLAILIGVLVTFVVVLVVGLILVWKTTRNLGVRIKHEQEDVEICPKTEPARCSAIPEVSEREEPSEASEVALETEKVQIVDSRTPSREHYSSEIQLEVTDF